MTACRLSIRAPLHRVTLAALLSVACSGCFTDAEGRKPDPKRLYFPTGLVVSPGATTLYVANSDFDLLFSGGSVQAVDLDTLRAWVSPIPAALHEGRSPADACASVGRGLNGDGWLNPGPCDAFPYEPLVHNAGLIGAFASGLLLVHRPEQPGARLFVPVRGDPSITYFDVDDDRLDPNNAGFRLDCAADEEGVCAREHRVGQDREGTLRGVQLPADPVGIAASADGVAIVSAHQTQKAASLVINDWDGVPWLSYFTSSLPSGPTEAMALPEPAFAAAARLEAEQQGRSFEYQAGFAVTFRAAPELDILRYNSDSGAVPPRPFLVRASATSIITNASNFDSRGLTIVDQERRACEISCGGEPSVDCLWACAEIPLKAYMANRSPSSLLIGEIETIVSTTTVDTGAGSETVPTSAVESVWFYDSVPLSFGPSRVEQGFVIDPAGELALRVFAVCFDTRSVYIYDPQANRVEAVVRTGRGPHDIAIDTSAPDAGADESYAYLYVGHFTDSYLGVVDLDMRRPLTYGQMVATIGSPTPPQGAK